MTHFNEVYSTSHFNTCTNNIQNKAFEANLNFKIFSHKKYKNKIIIIHIKVVNHQCSLI